MLDEFSKFDARQLLDEKRSSSKGQKKKGIDAHLAQRIKFLIQSSLYLEASSSNESSSSNCGIEHAAPNHHPTISQKLVERTKRLARHHNVHLRRAVRQLFCKRCCALLPPLKESTDESRRGDDAFIKCQKCGKLRRSVLPPVPN